MKRLAIVFLFASAFSLAAYGQDPGSLASKANKVHTHPESDITNLVSDLAGKAGLSHTHTEANITGLVQDLAAKSTDTAVVHNTGSETINGIKTFSVPLRITGTADGCAVFTSSALGSTGSPCGTGSGSATVVNVNGTPVITQSPVNFQNGSYIAVSNPSAGNIAFTLSALPESQVTNLVSDLSGKAASTHTHAESDVTNLISDLAGKAPSSHTHTEAQVTNLVSDLAGKANASHTHSESDTTNLVSDLAAKASSASPIFSGTVTFPITGVIQCVELSALGTMHGTGSPCGSGSGGMTNPMTQANDLIVGGSGGTPTRLPTQNSSILTTNGSGVSAWSTAIAESMVTNLVTDLAAKAPLTSPTLTTPVLGVATATSINKVTITQPATSAILTIVNGKTLTANNTVALSSISDGITVTFQGTDTIVGRSSTDTFTNKTFDTAGTGNIFKIAGTQVTTVVGTGSAVLSDSPALTGTPTAPTLAVGNNGTGIATTAFVKSQNYLTQAYNLMQSNGGGLIQRSILNFSNEFNAADNAGSTRTDVSLASVADSKISWATAPTNVATANAIVKRDASGNASFNAVTLASVTWSGSGPWGAMSPRAAKTDPTSGLSKIQFDADGDLYKCTASGAGACSWHRIPGTDELGIAKIASGSITLATSSIPANSCQTVTQGSVNSAAAAGVLATDTIVFTPNASIKAVTGYTPSGTLSIVAYPTAGYVNFDVCNRDQSNAVTPGSLILNYSVTR